MRGKAVPENSTFRFFGLRNGGAEDVGMTALIRCGNWCQGLEGLGLEKRAYGDRASSWSRMGVLNSCLFSPSTLQRYPKCAVDDTSVNFTTLFHRSSVCGYDFIHTFPSLAPYCAAIEDLRLSPWTVLARQTQLNRNLHRGIGHVAAACLSRIRSESSVDQAPLHSAATEPSMRRVFPSIMNFALGMYAFIAALGVSCWSGNRN
jgi:hypothetical protein